MDGMDRINQGDEISSYVSVKKRRKREDAWRKDFVSHTET